MPVVIKAIGFTNGARCPIAGQYLKSFDFEAHGGRGFGVFTLHLADATTFPDMKEAIQFWQTVPKAKPVREDGKPNRPLTATTCDFIPV